MLLHLKKLPREMLLQLFSNSRAGCCPPIDLLEISHTPPLNSCHRRIHNDLGLTKQSRSKVSKQSSRLGRLPRQLLICLYRKSVPALRRAQLRNLLSTMHTWRCFGT